MDESSLYFAYGSNLNTADLERWCAERSLPHPLGSPVSRAFLPDMELAFSYRSRVRRGGALDLRRRCGQLVPGVVFEVNQGGWKALDQKEGAGRNYERKAVCVLDLDGNVIPATTYIVMPSRKEPHVAPRGDYLATVRDGMAMHGVDGEDQLEAAAEGRDAPWLVDGLFAYGTLMRGERFFPQLEQLAELECALLATIRGRLLDLGAYPGMLVEGRGRELKGELFRFRNVDTVLRRIDEIEGFVGYGGDSLYERILMRVDAGNGRSQLAWTYVLADRAVRGSEIESGCWRRHNGRLEVFAHRLAQAHCGGREAEIAEELARQIPLGLSRRPREMRDSLLSIAQALLSGVVSERRLAQLSGQWVCVPDWDDLG